jgi:hypothetical protein
MKIAQKPLKPVLAAMLAAASAVPMLPSSSGAQTVADETSAASSSSLITGASFGFDELYKTGAEVADVYGPGDQGYRTLSMKVYTIRDTDGNLINQIGIVDITPGDITSPSLPRLIDSSSPGQADIVLHDGGRHYIVTVGSDGSVTLKRPGAADGGPGSIVTSKAQLSADRDSQIMNGGTVTIDGLPFYVLGQGGVKGSFLFFSQAQMQDSPNGNAHPELMGDVAQVVGDGTTSPIAGHPDLGQLLDGSAWHLEFDMQARSWKVVAGPGGDAKKYDQTDSLPNPPDDPTSPSSGPSAPYVTTVATNPGTVPVLSSATASALLDAGSAMFQP